MILTDKHNNIIDTLDTSFAVCYLSIFGKKTSIEKILSLLNKKDNGLIRFYPSSESYGPDIDDTSLFYISLIKKDKTFINDALMNINQFNNYFHNDLIVTWPHRPKEEQVIDPVVNLHFLWLLNLCNISNEKIENYLLSWLDKEDLTTSYYHNEHFILNSCNKASEDFITPNFKLQFYKKLQRQIDKKKIKIKNNYKDLHFENGCFRHIGKEIYFHFFMNKNMKTVKSKTQNLLNYYEYKKQKYSYINNDLEIMKKFNFDDSLFFKSGAFRLNKDGSPALDKLCLFDTTLYDFSMLDTPYSHEYSLSIRPHLNRTLLLLPKDISNIILQYWKYTYRYIQTNFTSLIKNSFMGIQTLNNNIPPHNHKKAMSTFTFVISIGDELNNSYFKIQDEYVKFPEKADFFAIHIEGEKAYHEVIKNDNNTYLYFIYDLEIEKYDNKTNFVLLNKI